jgi:hypothetical protein
MNSSCLKSRDEEIAENALLKGTTIEFAVEITGLPIQEVWEIAAKLGLNK